MSNYLKPVLALIISILLFAGFMFLANTELLNFVQAHFFNPSVVNHYVKENTIDAELVQSHIFELQSKFAQTLTESAVKSSFLYNQSADDIYERSRIFGVLLESTPGLQSVQFVDSNGLRIHYSTSSRDIMSQSLNSTSYRNYNEDALVLPYETVGVPVGENAKFTMDERNSRIVFSFPFSDSMEVYRGTALFNVSVRALAERLVAQGRFKINENVSVTEEPPGILLGSPDSSNAAVLEKVAAIWKDGLQGRVTLDAEDSGAKFSLISLKTGRGIFFGRLISDYLFSVSEPMKIILQLSIFLTFFLTLFFLINFKANSVTLVQNRLKRLRGSLFDQMYEKESGGDRIKWILELEQRREEIRSSMKRGIKLSRRREKIINGIIDKSWDELLAVIKAGSGQVLTVTTTAPPLPSAGKAEETSVPHEESLDGILDEVLDEVLEEVEEVGEPEEALDGVLDDVLDGVLDGVLDDVLEDVLEEVEEVEEFGEAEEDLEDVDILDQIEEIEYEPNLDEEADEIKPSGTGHKGLLELASGKAAKGRTKKGLLELASGKAAKSKPKKAKDTPKDVIEEIEEIEELEELEEVPTITIAKKGGLLSRAEKEHEEEEAPVQPRGLLAIAREIEFGMEYPVGSAEGEEDLDKENLDVVSPFSSMFSSLDGKEKKTKRKRKKV